MTEWDAAKYHRISEPQLLWGRAVVARLQPAAGERILDAGCGTGRLTIEIADTTGGVVVGLDPSAAMLGEAVVRRTEGRAAAATPRQFPVYVLGDAQALPFVSAFDAVFSNATFHWVPDHDRLFRSVYDALAPG
ncbi:MAG: class I SAM-dependent methyltransferase, partial [Catenulispora sp.]